MPMYRFSGKRGWLGIVRSLGHHGDPGWLAVFDVASHDLAFLGTGPAVEKLHGGGGMVATGFHHDLLLFAIPAGFLDIG